MSSQSVTLDNNSIIQLDRLIRTHRDEMSRILESTMKSISGSGMGSSIGLGGRSGGTEKDVREELKLFLSIMKKSNKALSAYEQYQVESAKRQVKSIDKRIKAEEKLKNSTDDNTNSTEDNTKSQNKNSSALDSATSRLGHWSKEILTGSLRITAMTKAVSEFEQAYKHGLNWNAISDSFNAAIKMGLSPADMMEFQAKFRRVSNTFSGGIDQFNSSVAANQAEWKKYTGSMKDAAHFQGNLTNIALSAGTSFKNIDSAVGTLFSTFKDLQAATSMTAEQFVSIQQSLLAEEGIRGKLLGLQGKERLNYMSGLSQTNMAFQALGLQQEVADKLVKFIEGQSGKEGKSRLKESAQLALVGSIVGMSQGDSQQLSALHRKRIRSKKENELYSALGMQFAERTEQYKSNNPLGNGMNHGEFMVDAMNAVAPIIGEFSKGFSEGALSSGAAADPATIARQALAIQERNEGLMGTSIDILTEISNKLGAWGESAVAALLGGVLGSKLLGRLFQGGGKPGAGGGKGGAGGGWGDLISPKFAKNLKRMGRGGLAGLVMGGGIATAQALSGPQSDNKNNLWDKGATGAAIGATLGSFIAPVIGTAIGGAIGGALGVGYGMIENTGMLDTALVKEKLAITENMNAAKMKHDFEQNAYQMEMDRIKAIGVARAGLDEGQIKRIRELEQLKLNSSKQFSEANSVNSANELIFAAKTIRELSDNTKSIAHGIDGPFSRLNYDKTNDISTEIAGIADRLGSVGIAVSNEELMQRYALIFSQVAQERGMGGNDEIHKTFMALKNGEQYDFDNSTTSKILSLAMQRMVPEIITATEGHMADMSSKNITKESIPTLVAKLETMAADTKNAQKIIEDQKRHGDHAQFSTASKDAKKTIDENQRTAEIIGNALSRLTDNPEMSNFLTQAIEHLSSISGNTKKQPFAAVK